LDVKKASGEPAFKAHLMEAIVKGKEGTEELGAIGIFSHKEDRTADSKMVCVGKKGVASLIRWLLFIAMRGPMRTRRSRPCLAR